MIRPTVFFCFCISLTSGTKAQLSSSKPNETIKYEKYATHSHSITDHIKGRDGRLLIFHGSKVPKLPLAAAPTEVAETPGSLGCIAGLTPRTLSCSAAFGVRLPIVQGGSQTIAIVIPYHWPTAASDLKAYDAYYGLPVFGGFSVAYATTDGQPPGQDTTGSWGYEGILDIEVAHALAPFANIVLVETTSNLLPDQLRGVDLASAIVTQNGGKGEVSMSWG